MLRSSRRPKKKKNCVHI